MPTLNEMGYEPEGVRRVASTLLRHVRPATPADAYQLLDGRLGVYTLDRSILQDEIDRYFDTPRSCRRAA